MKTKLLVPILALFMKSSIFAQVGGLNFNLLSRNGILCPGEQAQVVVQTIPAGSPALEYQVFMRNEIISPPIEQLVQPAMPLTTNSVIFSVDQFDVENSGKPVPFDPYSYDQYSHLMRNKLTYVIKVREVANPANTTDYTITAIARVSHDFSQYNMFAPPYCSDQKPQPINMQIRGMEPYFLEWQDQDGQTRIENIGFSFFEFSPDVTEVTILQLVDGCHMPIMGQNKIFANIIQTPDFSWDQSADSVVRSAVNEASLIAVPNALSSANVTYQWSGPTPGRNSPEIKQPEAGIYSLVITNTDPATMYSCSQRLRSRVVSKLDIPVITMQGGGNFCDGEPIIPISVEITGGIAPYILTYTAGNNAVKTVQLAESVLTMPMRYVIPEVVEGNYAILSLTDANNCSATVAGVSGHIAYLAKPDVSIKATPGIVQQGSPVLIEVFGADSYVWSNGMGTGDSKLLIPTESSIYSVTGTLANGCSEQVSIDVLVSSEKLTIDLGETKYLCQSKMIVLDAGVGADTYLWSTGETSSSITVAAAGTYSVTVTKGTLTANDEVEVLEAALPSIDLGDDIAVCGADNLPILQTSGFVSGYQYDWSDDKGNTFSSHTNVLDNTDPRNQYTEGKVYLTISANGCSASDTIAVRVDEPIQPNAGYVQICQGETIVLSLTNDYDSYVWNNGSTSSSIQASGEGLYNVTVTRGVCKSEKPFTFEIQNKQNEPLELNGVHPVCAGDTLFLQAHLHSEIYEWPQQTAGTSGYIVPQAGQVVLIPGITANGCRDTLELYPIVNQPPILNIKQLSSCQANSITLDAGAGFNDYIWSNGASGQTVIVPEGIYSVTVTLNGCIDRDTVNAVPDSKLVVDLGPDRAICTGSETTLDAGAGFDSYSWNDGSLGPHMLISQPGTYSVTVTQGKCIAQDEIIVAAIETPVFSLGNDKVLCSNEIATLSVPAATSVVWNDGSTMTKRNISAPGGTYSATVTANGCSYSDTVLLRFTSLPDFTILGTPVIYRGDTALYEVSAPFASYLWNTNALKRSITVNPQDDQTYWVQVADTYQCRDTGYITVEVLPRPEIGISDKTFCQGGSATLTVRDAFDEYSWSTGEHTRSIIVDSQGKYIIKARRIIEPMIALVDTISVDVIAKPVFKISGEQYFCEGTITTIGTEPDALARYQWSNGAETSWIDVAESGSYTLTVTAFGCSTVKEISVAAIPMPDAPVVSNYVPVCYNTSLPELTAIGDNIKWYIQPSASPVGEGNTFTISSVLQDGLAQGEESVIYLRTEDSQECKSDFAQVIVHRLTKDRSLDIISDRLIFCEGERGIPFSATSGFATYNWSISEAGLNSNSEERIFADFLSPGRPELSVIADDANGCRYTASATVTVVPAPDAQFTATALNGTACLNNTSLPLNKSMNSYAWSVDSGVFVPAVSRDTSISLSYGAHAVALVATSPQGCRSMVSKHIFSDVPFALYVPSALSPTSKSSQLSQFQVKGCNLSSFKLWIYDSWGNTVWFTNRIDEDGSPAESWSGTANGGLLPAGVYIWKIEARFANGDEWAGVPQENGTHKTMGNILLIR